MKYQNGEEAHLGDKVRVWDGCHGVVVASIDTDEFSSVFPKEQWAYLERGVPIYADEAGLIDYAEPDEDMELLERSLAR